MASRKAARTLATAASSLRQTAPRTAVFPELSSACAFSTSARTHQQEEAQRPRWQQTPARMVAPVRTRPLPQGPRFKVNNDPRRLDDVYVRMLGAEGDAMLSDEVKWLAVTHKSFDHGRRGFNDRLAFLGRRIVSLQTSLALINAPQAAPVAEIDAFGRRPHTHPALDGLQGLSHESKESVLDKARLGAIAQRYGLDKVTRWRPKRADNLAASGQDAVLTTSLYAIVGAIALERGGEVANRVAQEKILAPLGFTFSEQ